MAIRPFVELGGRSVPATASCTTRPSNVDRPAGLPGYEAAGEPIEDDEADA
jgi:hypothetical protein